MWDLRPDVWRDVACRTANRDLTQAEWQAYLGERPYEPPCS
jgi:hypothetical protein